MSRILSAVGTWRMRPNVPAQVFGVIAVVLRRHEWRQRTRRGPRNAQRKAKGILLLFPGSFASVFVPLAEDMAAIVIFQRWSFTRSAFRRSTRAVLTELRDDALLHRPKQFPPSVTFTHIDAFQIWTYHTTTTTALSYRDRLTCVARALPPRSSVAKSTRGKSLSSRGDTMLTL
jgi:hypothetical protein